MDVFNFLIDEGLQIFYEPKFRQIIADHKTFLFNHPESTNLFIESVDAYSDESDLSMILLRYKIPFHLHYPILVVNNLDGFDKNNWRNTTQLKIPSNKALDKIRTLYLTQNKIKI